MSQVGDVLLGQSSALLNFQVDRKAQVKDDRLRVTVGTIRSKVSHKESELVVIQGP